MKNQSPPNDALTTARAHLKAQRINEAAVAYSQIMEEFPENSEAPFYLGQISIQAGNLDQAVRYFQMADGVNPRQPEVLNSLAATLIQLGRLNEAVGVLEVLLTIVPDPSLWINLGVAQFRLQLVDAAETSFRMALELAPTSTKALCNLGGLCNELGRLDEAEALFNIALEIDQFSPEVWNNLGRLRINQGRPDAAEACYVRALEIRPDYTIARNNLDALKSALIGALGTVPN